MIYFFRFHVVHKLLELANLIYAQFLKSKCEYLKQNPKIIHLIKSILFEHIHSIRARYNFHLEPESFPEPAFGGVEDADDAS